MKRTIVLLLETALILALLLFALSSCEDENAQDAPPPVDTDTPAAECAHTPGVSAEIENSIPATCSNPGALDEVIYCTKCGEEISRKTITIAKKEHSFDSLYYSSLFHYSNCSLCGQTAYYEAHTDSALGFCSVCLYPTSETQGIKYRISDDKTYAYVSEVPYDIVAANIAETYEGLPVRAIGKKAFYSCNSLVIVNMPNTVTSIGESAFERCKKLAAINLSSSLESIGWCAFRDCTALTAIKLPSSTTTIGEGAFSYCNNLSSIQVGSNLTSIEADSFERAENIQYNEYDGALYLGNSINPYVILIKAKSLTIESCTVHEKTRLIADYAFQKCDRLKEITIPGCVSYVGDYAFKNCTELETINFESGVKIIDTYAFTGCSSLAYITLSDTIESINANAFTDCYKIKSVAVDQKNALYGDIEGSLYSKTDNTLIVYTRGAERESYTLPEAITVIGETAFKGSMHLKSVIISDGVAKIEKEAFANCEVL